MRTLLYTQEYPPFKGGIANYYGYLVANWPEPESIFVLAKKCHGRYRQYFSQLYGLARAVWKNKIDYILVGQILPLGPVAHLWWRLSKTKYAVFFHGMDLAFALKHPRKAWLTKLVLKDAHRIICANNYTAELLRANFPGLESKTIVSNPGVSEYPERVKLDFFRNESEPLILSIGRLVKRKGFASVIKALPKGCHYVIIGQGPELENLKELAGPEVNFIGQVSEAEKWSWLEACDLFIMPASDLEGDFEGFGIVYLEANLVAKPVIAGDSGGVRDAVEDGFNGLLVDPNDPRAIQAAIQKLIADPELRQRLGRQGRERALKEFNWPRQVGNIFQHLTDQI